MSTTIWFLIIAGAGFLVTVSLWMARTLGNYFKAMYR